MIALLGGSFSADAVIREALLASIRTLRRHQTDAGAIPNNVDLASRTPNFRAYADGGLWYVIGSAIAEPDYAAIVRTLRWYECQDVDQSDLISIQEASDWQDLFCTRGKSLYVNCLYVIALGKAAALAEARGKRRAAKEYRRRAVAVRNAINRYLWYPGDGEMLRHIAWSFSTPNVQHDSLGRSRWTPPKRILQNARYYLPYSSFRQVGEWFDALGNLMAILAGVADREQTSAILSFIKANGLDTRPMPAIYPPVRPGDPDWRDYYGELNLPGCYHNGGVWPFIGGFYVAALLKAGLFEEAAGALERLARLNLDGEFNEWHDGATGEPRGVCDQAWSAGMFIYACECAAAGNALLLDA
jgi:hypothetical protein